jgi:NADH dehydrogenase FAD-containing subunit
MGTTTHHNIVIIGGNFGGVGIAHYLLRHVIPALPTRDVQFKVILISPSSHTYYKIAGPRSVSVPESQLFYPISDAFNDYSESLFAFLQGTATAVDASAHTVAVELENHLTQTVAYDSLVLATGTTGSSLLWTLHGSHELTKTALSDTHSRLKTAKSVLIAGGGAVGVEIAGEIAHYFKVSSITLLSGSTRLLPRLQNSKVGETAQKILSAKGVTVIHKAKVLSSTAQPSGTTLVSLSDGNSKEVDVYVDATGGKPNTGFLPKSWLNESGYVVTEPTTLRAMKAGAGVYSVGDVASYSKQGLLDVLQAVPAIGYSIWFDLHSKYGDGASTRALKEKKYKQITSDMQFVPIGPDGGTGAVFGMKVPSWMVKMVKSKTFFVEKAPGLATGADYTKP